MICAHRFSQLSLSMNYNNSASVQLQAAILSVCCLPLAFLSQHISREKYVVICDVSVICAHIFSQLSLTMN